MNETDTLIKRIDNWTQDVLADELKMAAWVADCQSTNDAHKDAVIDDLLGETPKTLLVGKSATHVLIDDPWDI